jgi:DNA anti-recombination protein RmuC
MANPTNPAAAPESPREVDRVRDIIFGSQMRDYDQRFEAILRDLARLQRELDQANEQLAAQSAAQGKSLQALRQELRQADSDQRSETKAELERLAGQIAENDATQSQNLKALRQELRSADGDLRDELRQKAQRLTDEKVDRSTLGELFIELGNHIKTGGALADMLKGLEPRTGG